MCCLLCGASSLLCIQYARIQCRPVEFHVQVLGRALKDLPREKIIVATKVGRYDSDTFDFSAERVTKSVHESLERLQVRKQILHSTSTPWIVIAFEAHAAVLLQTD